MSSTVTSYRQEARQLRDQAREVDRDIDEARNKVQLAERLQWQLIGRSRPGDRGRTVAALGVVQHLKRKARKEIQRMQNEKQNLEREANEAEKQAEQQREKEQQEKEKKQERNRRRSRGRDNDRDQDNDHDRDPF